eukprot:6180736-Alexandrium_andersonii.AAC.1
MCIRDSAISVVAGSFENLDAALSRRAPSCALMESAKLCKYIPGLVLIQVYNVPHAVAIVQLGCLQSPVQFSHGLEHFHPARCDLLLWL